MRAAHLSFFQVTNQLDIFENKMKSTQLMKIMIKDITTI